MLFDSKIDLIKHVLVVNRFVSKLIFNHVHCIHAQLKIAVVKRDQMKTCDEYTRYRQFDLFFKHFESEIKTYKKIGFDPFSYLRNGLQYIVEYKGGTTKQQQQQQRPLEFMIGIISKYCKEHGYSAAVICEYFTTSQWRIPIQNAKYIVSIPLIRIKCKMIIRALFVTAIKHLDIPFIKQLDSMYRGSEEQFIESALSNDTALAMSQLNTPQANQTFISILEFVLNRRQSTDPKDQWISKVMLVSIKLGNHQIYDFLSGIFRIPHLLSTFQYQPGYQKMTKSLQNRMQVQEINRFRYNGRDNINNNNNNNNNNNQSTTTITRQPIVIHNGQKKKEEPEEYKYEKERMVHYLTATPLLYHHPLLKVDVGFLKYLRKNGFRSELFNQNNMDSAMARGDLVCIKYLIDATKSFASENKRWGLLRPTKSHPTVHQLHVIKWFISDSAMFWNLDLVIKETLQWVLLSQQGPKDIQLMELLYKSLSESNKALFDPIYYQCNDFIDVIIKDKKRLAIAGQRFELRVHILTAQTKPTRSQTTNKRKMEGIQATDFRLGIKIWSSQSNRISNLSISIVLLGKFIDLIKHVLVVNRFVRKLIFTHVRCIHAQLKISVVKRDQMANCHHYTIYKQFDLFYKHFESEIKTYKKIGFDPFSYLKMKGLRNILEYQGGSKQQQQQQRPLEFMLGIISKYCKEYGNDVVVIKENFTNLEWTIPIQNAKCIASKPFIRIKCKMIIRSLFVAAIKHLDIAFLKQLDNKYRGHGDEFIEGDQLESIALEMSQLNTPRNNQTLISILEFLLNRRQSTDLLGWISQVILDSINIGNHQVYDYLSGIFRVPHLLSTFQYQPNYQKTTKSVDSRAQVQEINRFKYFGRDYINNNNNNNNNSNNNNNNNNHQSTTIISRQPIVIHNGSSFQKKKEEPEEYKYEKERMVHYLTTDPLLYYHPLLKVDVGFLKYLRKNGFRSELFNQNNMDSAMARGDLISIKYLIDATKSFASENQRWSLLRNTQSHPTVNQLHVIKWIISDSSMFWNIDIFIREALQWVLSQEEPKDLQLMEFLYNSLSHSGKICFARTECSKFNKK
ncbi:hypothetical protein DFA_09596 [Cavenderia fasciculata]|uniref:Uncharacterized protein n=1 Tax=Cavenderia fasciculata TaxID=261658 RepID=F4Q825_CACFS|nr:uncharacterized protein DFA_09596 [Cavenderia fasciculata]EGG15925.1 hypothetical protein DFA_09596 [Cavenderia fasciculata]|eukprot:XP_004352250.1 hypothetical protein DFA_09596 [Cavenderia fasciculata]